MGYAGFSLFHFFMGGMIWLFIVGLFCYICIFHYLYVDSLTYAFGWSAFMCRFKFCDTLVVMFLSKHHHHHADPMWINCSGSDEQGGWYPIPVGYGGPLYGSEDSEGCGE
jgi:hypothetical protein